MLVALDECSDAAHGLVHRHGAACRRQSHLWARTVPVVEKHAYLESANKRHVTAVPAHAAR